jgi:hypothetical protein
LTLEEFAKITEFLEAAKASPRLGNWDRGFVNSLVERHAEWGRLMDISPRQQEQIDRIDGLIHAAG